MIMLSTVTTGQYRPANLSQSCTRLILNKHKCIIIITKRNKRIFTFWRWWGYRMGSVLWHVFLIHGHISYVLVIIQTYKWFLKHIWAGCHT